MIRQWDPVQGDGRGVLKGHSEGVRAVAFAPDSERLVSAGWDGTVLLRPLGQAWRVAVVLEADAGAATSAAFACGGSVIVSGHAGGCLKLWDATKPWSELATLQHGSPVFALAVAPDGKTAASGGSDGSIKLWDVAGRKALATLRAHAWVVYALAFAPDGGGLLSGSADGSVKLWELPGCRERAAFQWHARWVNCVAFAPDAMTAAAGSDDHTIVIWDVD
jgi:WD40 repeat protein